MKGELILQEMGIHKYIVISLIAVTALSVSLYLSADVLARATGVTSITPGTDDYGPDVGSGSSDPARGGVITSLTLNATGQTNNWQGYYGWVGQYIVLADSEQRYMYSWNTSDQSSGSVLTSRASSVNWGSLAAQATCTVEDSIIPDAVNDKVSSTFTSGAHTTIIIGNVTISANTCTTDLFVDNVSNTTWEENLLTDGTNYIYQAFFHTGYRVFSTADAGTNITANFQMIVPEDEAGAAGTTNYYFWLELN